MVVQATSRVRIISKSQGTSLGGTDLTSGFIVPNRAGLYTGGPTTTYGQSQIERGDYLGGTNTPVDFDLPFGWPIELMYPTPSQGEEQRLEALLKTTAVAAASQVTGVVSTGGISFGGVFGIQLAAAGIDTGVEVGDLVRVRDSSDVLLGIGEVYGVSAGVVMVTQTTTIPDGTNRKVLRMRRIKPGTTKTYHALEVALQDLTSYKRIQDWIPTSWSWGFQLGQNGIRGAWDGIGRSYATPQGSPFSVTPVTETTTPIFAPKVQTTVLRFNGTDLRVLEMSATVGHPAQAAKIATSLTADDVVPGRITGGGSLRIYQTGSIYDALVLAGTAGSMMVAFVASTGAILAVRWPSVRLTNLGARPEGPMVSEAITWAADLHATENNAVTVFTSA